MTDRQPAAEEHSDNGRDATAPADPATKPSEKKPADKTPVSDGDAIAEIGDAVGGPA